MVSFPEAFLHFYQGIEGRIFKKRIKEILILLFPLLDRRKLLCLGYPLPFLDFFQKEGICTWGVNTTFSAFAHGISEETQKGEGEGASFYPKYRNFVCAEAEALPFLERSFDAVLGIHFLEYTSSPLHALHELWRVLKYEGCLILIVPNRYSLWTHKALFPFAQGQRFSIFELTSLFGESLFFLEEIRGILPFFPPLRWMPQLSPSLTKSFEELCWFGASGLFICTAYKRLLGGNPSEEAITEPFLRLRKEPVLPRC